MYARIDTDNVVVELWDVSELPPLHPAVAALYWPAPAGTQIGDVFDPYSQLYSPPPPEPIEQAVARKLAEISDSCEAEIVSGFYSSALGAQYLYQSERDDQLNLVGAVATGTDMPYKCQDGDGVWAYRLHTAAQLAQVLADGAAKKLAHLQHYADLKAQIELLTTNTEVEAVTW